MNSFISWIGGKNYLKRAIYRRMPRDISSYIEAFGGAAWVLFYKDRYADTEVYNDFNGDLVNLFRCVKYHRPEIQRELSGLLNSREIFDAFKRQFSVGGMTDIQRAARFFYLIKVSYGANGRNFGCIRKDVTKMTEYLTRIENRLSTVIIEHKDFEDLLRVYDRPCAFFYLDPPYWGTERYYQVKFKQEDHLRLAESLKNLKGRFVLSYNDCEMARDLYKGFTVEEVSRTSNLQLRYSSRPTYRELLIRNY